MVLFPFLTKSGGGLYFSPGFNPFSKKKGNKIKSFSLHHIQKKKIINGLCWNYWMEVNQKWVRESVFVCVCVCLCVFVLVCVCLYLCGFMFLCFCDVKILMRELKMMSKLIRELWRSRKIWKIKAIDILPNLICCSAGAKPITCLSCSDLVVNEMIFSRNICWTCGFVSSVVSIFFLFVSLNWKAKKKRNFEESVIIIIIYYSYY